MKSLSTKSRWLLFFTCILFSINAILATALTYYLAKIMENAEDGRTEKIVSAVLWAIVVLLLYILSAIGAEALRLHFLANEELSLKYKIMNTTFLRPISLFRRKDDAYYMNLLTTDMDLYRNDGLRPIPNIVSSGMSMLAAALMLYMIHPILFWGSILLCGIPLAVNNIFTKSTQKWKENFSSESEKYSGILKEIIEGNETIRNGSGTAAFLRRFQKISEKKQQAFTKSSLINHVAMQFFFGIASMMQIASLAIGGYLAAKGEIAVSMLFAAMNYYIAISNHLCNIVAYWIDIRSVKTVRDKILSESISPSVKEETIFEKPEEIAYDHVSFSFGDHVLYEDFSCVFAKNGCYMIAGESGSGKSTLMKLLLKYYEDYAGKITIGGKDIRDLSENEIYSVIGIVSQTPYLFNTSLYENITLLKETPAMDSEEYRKLLCELKLDQLAARVGDMPLGDFGDNISGGERQRINIARAMCRKPQIMIFDEPTTGLDPENVKLINEFIFGRSDLTRIVISHDWSEEYRNRFDKILYIGSGSQCDIG